MDDQQYIDIADFIKGNYNEEQQKLFEQKIVDDPLFAEQVAHYISTIAIAKQLQEEEKKKKLKALYYQQQKEKKAKIHTLRKWVILISIAASLIIMITGYFTLFQNKAASGNIANNKKRNEQEDLTGKKKDSTGIANNTGVDSALKAAPGNIANNKNRNEQEDLTDKKKDSTGIANNTRVNSAGKQTDRKPETPRKGLDKVKLQQLYAKNFIPDTLPEDKEGPLEDAFAYYEMKAYNKATVAFEKADLNTETREPEEERTVFYAYYYKALSYMANSNVAEAIPELNKAMQESTDSILSIKTKWYLSLAYLKTGNLKKTEELLDEIISNVSNMYKTGDNAMSAIDLDKAGYRAKAIALWLDLDELRKQ
jgi:tetratricopeptide (TPR) repeat protein